MHNASLQISDISRLTAVDFVEYHSIYFYGEREGYSTVKGASSGLLGLLHLDIKYQISNITKSHIHTQ
jgi:hypothetical protein